MHMNTNQQYSEEEQRGQLLETDGTRGEEELKLIQWMHTYIPIEFSVVAFVLGVDWDESESPCETKPQTRKM